MFCRGLLACFSLTVLRDYEIPFQTELDYCVLESGSSK